jgi:HlyD family secretion protein
VRKAVAGLAGIAIAAGLAAAAWYATRNGGPAAGSWRVAEVDSGPISLSVSSSGNIKPVVTVNVGTQVSGQVSELLADFNTPVKEGQVIARIDPGPFDAKVQEARGELAFAQASVAIQKATLAEFRAELSGVQAKLVEADRDLERKKSLLERKVVASSAVDTAVATQAQARATVETQRARLARQEAQIRSAEAQVVQKEATLRQREFDLDHTIIRSPVDGVVIQRSVDIGQTVAASLQAPVLFTIAQDLSKMQVETSVDEADIGRVREGQEVRFTVDAYPDRSFEGAVQQIRLSPIEVSNVITYTVVVSAENPDLALLPGMTANVEVVVGRREGVLRVPNAALRFAPPGAAAATATGAAPAAPATPEDRREAARKRLEARVAELEAKLSLSARQKEEVTAILRDSGRAVGMIARSGGTEAQVRAAAQKARAEGGKRIEALLDEAQRKTFRLLQAESVISRARPARVWIVGDDGAPRPVDLQVGLSDGQKTEIRQGDLKPGDKVIVGRNAPSGAS